MPGMDGKKFVDYARAKGVPAKRIVVTSSHSADELHQRFRIGETIADQQDRGAPNRRRF